MADTLSRERRSWNMSRITGKNTVPELQLRSKLHKEGYRFRLHDQNLPGKPDIVLPKHRAVIFVNGCFWHRHESCKFAYTPKSRREFWLKKFEKTLHRDRENQKILVDMGWKVIVVWECELKKDALSVVSDISSMLQENIHGN